MYWLLLLVELPHSPCVLVVIVGWTASLTLCTGCYCWLDCPTHPVYWLLLLVGLPHSPCVLVVIIGWTAPLTLCTGCYCWLDCPTHPVYWLLLLVGLPHSPCVLVVIVGWTVPLTLCTAALNISTGPLALRTFQTAGPVRASTYISFTGPAGPPS